jgi:hypothetical protein
LRRQAALPIEKVVHPPRPGVVSRSGKAKIAEFAAQFSEKLRCFRERQVRVEGIIEPARRGRVGHELRNPLSPMTGAGRWPNRVRLKSTLFPDHSGEELQRQPIRCRCRFEDQAGRFGQVGSLLHCVIAGL